MDSRCPRPDKLSFDTEEEARGRYTALLVTDQTLAIYLCMCGKWHAGRSDQNVEKNAIASTPRISTGFNPVSEPVAPAPPRRRRREVLKRCSEVRSVTVSKKVWRDALRRADGDSTRIQVIDETNVIIHNNGNWRSRRAESKSGA